MYMRHEKHTTALSLGSKVSESGGNFQVEVLCIIKQVLLFYLRQRTRQNCYYNYDSSHACSISSCAISATLCTVPEPIVEYRVL